jgi:hypothetical protein
LKKPSEILAPVNEAPVKAGEPAAGVKFGFK